MPIGERITTQYIPHPPAASGFFADGRSLDAGSAMIVHSNLSHLAERNTRLIGHAIGPGDVTNATTFTTPWADAIDVSWDPADTITANPYGAIPWTVPTTAMNFGPFAMAMTRLQTAPAGHVPRKVRVVVQAYKSNQATTYFRVFAVLMGGAATPLSSPAARLAQAASSVYTDASPGAKLIDLTLDCAAPVPRPESWRSRPTSASAPAQTAVAPGWVWVGWGATTTGTPDRIESISVFEMRD